MTRVNVNVDGNDVVVLNGTTGAEINRYTIVKTAKKDMAWDVKNNGTTSRLVAQAGCGCGGMKNYEVDASYNGPLDVRGNVLA